MKQETLAKLTGYTRPTVNAALQALEDVHGLIASETRRYDDGRNAAKVYRLNTRVKELYSGESRVNEVYTDRVNAVDTDRVKDVYNKNQEHRTVNQEPKKREGKTDAFDPLKVDLPEGVTLEAWTEFVSHRREIRKPLTPTATKRTLADLVAKSKGPHERDEILRVSIARGWTGVFELDGARKPSRSSSSDLAQYRERGL